MCLTAVILAALSVGLSAWAVIQVEAIKRSTHQITYIDPMKQTFQPLTDEIRETLTKEPEEYSTLN